MNMFDIRRRMMLEGGVSADPILENNDWETISKIARAGKAAEYWNIGDLKNININGAIYAAQIIGFDHDDVVDSAVYGREKAGITFQLQNCLNTTYSINYPNDNKCAWENCTLRTTTLVNFYNDFANYDPKLHEAITKVKKYYINASNIGTTVEDNLFLLSEMEVMGTVTYAKSAEGNRYAYYAAGNSYSKNVNGTPTMWWERSIYKGNNVSFTGVYPTTGYYYAMSNLPYGVAFAFCV